MSWLARFVVADYAEFLFFCLKRTDTFSLARHKITFCVVGKWKMIVAAVVSHVETRLEGGSNGGRKKMEDSANAEQSLQQ